MSAKATKSKIKSEILFFFNISKNKKDIEKLIAPRESPGNFTKK